MGNELVMQVPFEVLQRLGSFVQYFQGMATDMVPGVPGSFCLPGPLLTNIKNFKTTDDVTDAQIKACLRPIEFYDGVATIDGVPVWERLEGETEVMFRLFQQYRDMKQLQGYRTLLEIISTNEVPGRTINALARAYQWALRCELYDKQLAVFQQLKNAKRMEAFVKSTKQASEDLLELAMDYFKDNPDAITPKIAIQMIELSVKTGREAYELSAPRSGGRGGSTINIQNNVEAPQIAQSSVTAVDEDTTCTPDFGQSILNVLGAVGALDPAGPEDDEDIVEVEPTEVTDDDFTK